MRKALAYLWGTLLVLALWWLLAAALGSPALPTPLATLPVLAEEAGAIWPHFWVSFGRIMAAMAIGTVLGAPLGLLLGRDRLEMGEVEAQAVGPHAGGAHLQLQVGDDREQVGVAHALADAVRSALHLRGPRPHSCQRVRHCATGVVVAVDAHRHPRQRPRVPPRRDHTTIPTTPPPGALDFGILFLSEHDHRRSVGSAF